MTIFVDTNLNGEFITLDIRGEKIGRITGKTTYEASIKLLSYLALEDTVYVDVRGLGTSIADILSRYIQVVRVCPRKQDIIN